MRTTFTLIALMAMFTFTSCKKESDKEVTTEETATDSIAVANETAVFEPFQVMAVSHMTKAKARLKDPELKKIMTEAGVMSEPTFNFYTLVE